MVASTTSRPSAAPIQGQPLDLLQPPAEHIKEIDVNILSLTNGVTLCQSTAIQTYFCNGHAIGTFFLTNTYSSGIIATQPVTFVSVSKQ
jgi:hypothetical protein